MRNPLAVPQGTLETAFAKTGTTRLEAGRCAFPAHLVTPRLTTTEELAECAFRAERGLGGRPSVSQVEHVRSGEAGHRSHGVRFHMSDATVQWFPPRG
jgi:hypothetical protein